MIVTTKTGDQGTTEIQSGRISKADPLLEVLGDLDELSADCLVFASLTPAYLLSKISAPAARNWQGMEKAGSANALNGLSLK